MGSGRRDMGVELKFCGENWRMGEGCSVIVYVCDTVDSDGTKGR